MSYSDKMGEKLNELLEKNYDAEAGYKNAAEKVENSALTVAGSTKYWITFCLICQKHLKKYDSFV